MAFPKGDKKRILNEFLRRISHISDKEYQERVWIQGKGPEIDDFDETCCHFFDDGDPILERYKEYAITETQYDLLKKFRNRFSDFADDNDLAWEFINTPEWEQIMGMAKEVLQAFNYQSASQKKYSNDWPGLNNFTLTTGDEGKPLEDLIGTLTQITRKNESQGRWVLKESEEGSSEDTIRNLFIKCDLILENYKNFGITDIQYQLLKTFKDKFGSLSNKNDWQINSSTWIQIIAMAKELLKSFIPY